MLANLRNKQTNKKVSEQDSSEEKKIEATAAALFQADISRNKKELGFERQYRFGNAFDLGILLIF